MKSVYEALQVRVLINAAGTKTRLGGIPMAPEVWQAMRAAGEQAVDMAELQAAASRVIARVTGAEAGYATSGAASGLTLSAAACLTGLDPAKVDRLPHTLGMPNEIVIARSHRNSYDHAWRAAGAHLVEVGFDDRVVGSGVRGVEAWEFEAAFGPDTVAVAFVATRHNLPLLERVVDVAHGHGLPVLVDAAAQLPPIDNLRTFIAAGADLVAFSGGKAVGGPQSTGFLAGRRTLVQAVMLNHLDFDVQRELWSLPAELFAGAEVLNLPRHGLGRGFKVSKENIVGLLTALERFASGAGLDGLPSKQATAAVVCTTLASSSHVQASMRDHHGIPVVDLRFATAEEAAAFYRGLLEGTPAVAVDPSDVEFGRLAVNTIGLSAEAGNAVVQAIAHVHDALFGGATERA